MLEYNKIKEIIEKFGEFIYNTLKEGRHYEENKTER